VDILYFSECGVISNESGNAADTAAVKEYHQMAVHYGILTPYADAATDNSIFKIDLLTA
jgi:hypothetical protein